MKAGLLVGVGPGSRTTDLLVCDIRVDGLSEKAGVDTTVLDAVLEGVSCECYGMKAEEDINIPPSRGAAQERGCGDRQQTYR
jgi:hypothetical protein